MDTDSDTDTTINLTSPDDDDFEENDEIQDAYPVYPPVYLDAIVCSSDDDYFRFHVDQGQAIAIRLSFINTFGDIDVSLYGQSGAEISFTHSTTDNEELSYPAEESGEYTIKIYGWENAVNTYGLKVILTDADADTDSDSNTENH